MEKLRFGATINPNGSLRKIHILENVGLKILCKKVHLHKIFNARYVYSYENVPCDVYFCKGCAKKSKFKKGLLNVFQFKSFKKRPRTTYKEEITSNSEDEEYIPPNKKRRKQYMRNSTVKTSPAKIPVRENEVKPNCVPNSLFDKPCYYCNEKIKGCLLYTSPSPRD